MVDGDVLPPIVPPKNRSKGKGEPPICVYCKKRYLTVEDHGPLFCDGRYMTDIELLSSPVFHRHSTHVIGKDGKNYHLSCLINQIARNTGKLIKKLSKESKSRK